MALQYPSEEELRRKQNPQVGGEVPNIQNPWNTGGVVPNIDNKINDYPGGTQQPQVDIIPTFGPSGGGSWPGLPNIGSGPTVPNLDWENSIKNFDPTNLDIGNYGQDIGGVTGGEYSGASLDMPVVPNMDDIAGSQTFEDPIPLVQGDPDKGWPGAIGGDIPIYDPQVTVDAPDSQGYSQGGTIDQPDIQIDQPGDPNVTGPGDKAGGYSKDITYPEPRRDLEKQDWLTEAGNKLEDAITKGLSETDPFVDAMMRKLPTDISRMTYDNIKRAREAAGANNIQPGTAQYSRMMKEAMSPVYDYKLGRQQQIADTQRQRYDLALEKAKVLEDTAYGKAVGERGYQTGMDDIDYMRKETDTIRDESTAMTFINSIQDQKTKQRLMKAFMDGGYEAVKTESQLVIDEGGTLTDPGQSNVASMWDEAEEVVDRMYPDATDAEKEKLTQDHFNRIWEAQFDPLTEADKQREEGEYLEGPFNTVDEDGKDIPIDQVIQSITSATPEQWEAIYNDKSAMSKLRSSGAMGKDVSGKPSDFLYENSMKDYSKGDVVKLPNGKIIIFDDHNVEVTNEGFGLVRTERYANVSGTVLYDPEGGATGYTNNAYERGPMNASDID